MAITLADFNKIWASTSPLTPYSFSESNYKQGWNFIGSTPPARQMWDFLQKNNDEKMQYLANNYLPLSGGTMSGVITLSFPVLAKKTSSDKYLEIDGGTSAADGANLIMFGKDESRAGAFWLTARDSANTKQLIGKPDGTLTWDGKNVLTDATVGTVVSQSFTSTTTLSANTETNLGSITLSAGTWVVTGHIRYTNMISGRQFIGLNSSLYIGSEIDGTVVHYSNTADNSTLALSTTRIFVLYQSTTVYLIGYATSSCVSAINNLCAVRII